MQFTKMHQKFMFVCFILIELICKIFEFISLSKSKFSLLHSAHSSVPLFLVFYMNDQFDEFENFEKLFCFFKNHFLSKIKWIKLMLFFKKFKLFEKFLIILNVVHTMKKCFYILFEKIRKIIIWSIFKNFSIVRNFLNIIKIIKKWIRNFIEIIKSLFRLTEKVKWHWEKIEQLFFEILKIKCFVTINMNEINFTLIFHFYVDVFEFVENLTIIQKQLICLKNKKNTFKNDYEKVSIIYDSFVFNKTQRKWEKQ